MVHEKFIKKDGKVYGPYLYKNYRVNGVTKTRYLGANAGSFCANLNNASTRTNSVRELYQSKSRPNTLTNLFSLLVGADPTLTDFLIIGWGMQRSNIKIKFGG